MGTRHLICVFNEGEYKVAQYGQWDGHPDSQGAKVLEFLSEIENQDMLKKALSKVRFFDPDGIDKEFYTDYQANAPGWSNEPDNRTYEQKHWFARYISRDIGYGILYNIVKSEDESIVLKNNLAFAGDSLFCEFCYVIDFDNNTFEVYTGFNKEVTEGRFSSSDDSLEKTDGFEPVALAKTYYLDDLPLESKFVDDLMEDEDEDEE